MNRRSLAILMRAVLALAVVPVASAHAEPTDSGIAMIEKAIRDGGLQIDVRFAQLKTTVFDGPPPQGQYLGIYGYISNVGNVPVTFDAMLQYLVDRRGRIFAPSTGATYTTSAGFSSLRTDLNPGNSTKSSLMFDIPSATTISEYTMVWRQSAASGGVALPLLATKQTAGSGHG